MRQPMTLIDSHCHLDLPVFDPDRDTVLSRCAAQGIEHIVVPAINAAGWPRLLSLCDAHDGLHPALGLHPMLLATHRAEHVEQLNAELRRTKVLAVGEIGLDFYPRDANRSAQISLFEAQLDIATRHDLPVLLHVRKAHDEVLKILKGAGVRGGIAHAFNGSLQQARRYIELGFCLGFGGMLTYPRSRRLHALASELPLASLVLETDAPDMTGAAHHGARNSPEYLPEVAQALTALRGCRLERVIEATSANVVRVLNLP